MRWLRSRSPGHTMYKLVGPTTVHLRHEFYLLVALILLTISSLQACYVDTFGSWGDCKFLFLITLWLARHLVLRWLSTSDASTSKSPTLSGLLVFWWTSYLMAGQYFDRPNPQVVAKQLGTAHTDDGRIVTSIASFLSPSIRYCWQLVRVRLWFPLLDLYDRLWRALPLDSRKFSLLIFPVASHQASSPKISLGVNQAHAYWIEFWTIYVSLQTLIPIATVLFYIWYCVTIIREPEISYPLTMNSRNLQEEELDSKAFGSYTKLLQPTMTQMVMALSAVGTLAAILLYNQIVLPLPDLVAGSNVLKAVRNEAKINVSNTTVS